MCKTYYIISGGFDPLHEGHLDLITQSREESDGVIVLLQSDAWLTQKKGKPFMNLATRTAIMSNIKGVIDVITEKDVGDVPCDIYNGFVEIRRRYPNDILIFARGGDKTPENMPESGAKLCQKLNIRIIHNVGLKVHKRVKANSSSRLLDNWEHRNDPV